MRVLTVSHFYESHGGGIERVAGQLCREFNRQRATAVWAASDKDRPPAQIESVVLRCLNPIEKVTGLPMPLPGIRGARALARAIKQSDAVVIHDALYATSVLAMVVAKMRRKPVLLVQHIASIPFSSGVLRTLMKIANKVVTGPMLRSADVRVFISDTVRRDLVGASPECASELLFNGVDRAIFNPGGGRLPQVPQAIRAIQAQVKILFVGRYVEKKGLAVLRHLAAARRDLDFFLAGSGPQKPAQWGLPNVHDLGPQTSEELAALYRWADLLVLPSVGEGFPLVIQEAMACGLPVICGTPTERADPVAAQWLRGVEIDLSQPVESAQRCAVAIDDFEMSSEQRAKMARYALKHYDWAKMAGELLSLARRHSVLSE